ncbi:MAG: hypothetical protein EOO73_20135 [Myxococcales bacterium]|nr:MAG: hypothetical protein EOO73_20135 [Myxococcales bacterium]
MKRGGRLGRLIGSGALGILLASAEALGEYRHRVLLLERAAGDDASREITTRVRAELSAAGFDVLVIPAPEIDPQAAVENAGRELHPASVLLVQPEELGSDLWLADRMLRKTVVLRLRSGPERDQEAARIAVQAVELVKARLAELAVTREHEAALPAAPPPPPPQSFVAAPAGRGARPNLTLGVALLENFQRSQNAISPVIRLGVALPEGWTGDVLALDFRGSFIGLGRAARIEQGPGAATLRHTAVALDAVMRFLPRRRVQPFVSLGGGFLALDVAGVAPDPYRNSSARTLSGLVNASGGAWLKPFSNLGLVLEAQLLQAWSKTVVRIAGEDAAEVAAPLLVLSGGLMAEF